MAEPHLVPRPALADPRLTRGRRGDRARTKPVAGAASALLPSSRLCGSAPIAGAQEMLSPEPGTEALDRLVAAYPDALARHDDAKLYWRDGTAMSLSDGESDKSLAAKLRHASILDQLSLAYPAWSLTEGAGDQRRSGPVPQRGLLSKDVRRLPAGRSGRKLVSLDWLPESQGAKIEITSVNRVDEALRAVSAEIDALPNAQKRAAFPIAGTYNCRAVADTGQPSGHGYGIAIDLNLAYSDYWYWHRHDVPLRERNRMPAEIVAIFEKHGFIWGGKWYHDDTMHFEYRPELLR